jgi:hypothetical protein
VGAPPATGYERRLEVSVPYVVYQVLHVAALAAVFAALGGAAIAARLAPGERTPVARLLAITHGVALVLLLVAGFGMLAKLGIGMPPGWAWAKIVLWLALGGLVAVVRRAPHLATGAFLSLPVIAGLSAWLAHSKPF